MTLIPLFTKKITLPDLKIINTKIGKNMVLRFAFRERKVEVTVFDSIFEGWYELRTQLEKPYDYLYLRKKKPRKTAPNQRLCLEFVEPCDINDLEETTKLKWIEHPGIKDKKSPDNIVSDWVGKFQFKEDRPDLKQSGLRVPQLGALHAISAYFTLEKNLEPATVVLPTGTGKTETMLSVMVYRGLPRVLVIVPSNSLRNQICDKFYGLGHLIDLGLIPIDTPFPAVTIIKHGIKSIAEADELLQNSNVFIATANVINSSEQDAINHLCLGISDLFVDEAHHISASIWSKIRDRFIGKRVTQFTATPFRTDGNSLGGKIIYNYTLGEAQKADYFKHINLIPVEEYFLEEGDRSIAQAAIKQLRHDLEKGHDHLLMARVEKKQRADEILLLYRELAPEFNPIVVHSGMRNNLVQNALSSLINRKSKIVVCVNMLGEGFDLPNLKIAAIHDIHKSLAITLQFIGRFTRKLDSDASVVVNIADAEVEHGLQQLYSQGADWDSILKRLSEKRVDRELGLQDIVEQLKENGTLHEQLALWNLRPVCSAILFKTTCDNWSPQKFKELIPDKSEHWYSISDERKLLIVLAIHHAPVTWGSYKELNDSVYKLLIVHWDVERSGLFIFSNDYKWFRTDQMAKLLCDNQCELLSGPKVFNVFNGLQYPLVRNLGASQVGAISFTQYFGPNVTEGLNKIESAKSDLSNLAGLGYDNGEKVLWGCSQKKGKIWSVNSGSIFDWTVWVKTAWDKVTSGKVDETNITRDFLRPRRITEYHDKHVIAVQWGEHIQADPEDRVMIIFGDVEVPLYLVELKIVAQGNGDPYKISVSSEESLESVYDFTIDGKINSGFSYQIKDGKSVFIKRGNGVNEPLEDYLLRDPWILQYVDGSFSYNCFLIELPHTIGEFPAEQIESWDWSGVDISKESMGKSRETDTVQWRSFEQIKEQYDVIFNDDGPGEAADLVGLKIIEDKIHLGLVHCKYSGASTPGARINDLYEVCGQAQKTIRWKHAGISRLYGHLKGREARWQTDKCSRFLKGSMSDLSNIKRRARTAQVVLSVSIIQPGLKRDTITPEMLRVIGSTFVYLKNTAQADLYVIGS
ncbi:MAG TPA: type III restriction endonuclease subunit R [Rikenellaceae bacterium]|nr:type III restriction endonuclease subunit R [Rikenellaceae bacterium]